MEKIANSQGTVPPSSVKRPHFLLPTLICFPKVDLSIYEYEKPDFEMFCRWTFEKIEV